MIEDKESDQAHNRNISLDMQEANRLMQDSLFPSEGKTSGGSLPSSREKSSLLGFCELMKQVYGETGKHFERISLNHYRSAARAQKKNRTEWVEICSKAADLAISVVSRCKTMEKFFAEMTHVRDRHTMIPELGGALEDLLEYKDSVLSKLMAKSVSGATVSDNTMKKLELSMRYSLERKEYLRKPEAMERGIDEQLIHAFKRSLVDMPKEGMQAVMKELVEQRDNKSAVVAIMRDVVSKQKLVGILEQFQNKVMKYLKPERKEKMRNLLNKIPKQNHAGLMRELVNIRDNLVEDRLKEIQEAKKRK